MKVNFEQMVYVFIILVCKTIWMLSRGNLFGDSLPNSKDGWPAKSISCGCQKWGFAYDNLPLAMLLKRRDFLKICFVKQKD